MNLIPPNYEEIADYMFPYLGRMNINIVKWWIANMGHWACNQL